MIPAGCTELRKAYFDHDRVSQTGGEDSHHLLHFYSLECGLKSIYLRSRKLYRSDQIPDERLRRTHDLFLFVKELRLPAQVTGAVAPSFRLQRDGNSFEVRHAHEVWRDGIKIRENDARALAGWMHKINSWVEENI